MTLKVFILGANGFIGNSLVEHILKKTAWNIIALDLHTHYLESFLNHPHLQFKQGNMLAEKTWIEEQVKACDVVLPLAAIATPATYVNDPLRIFELDFEANLAIVRLCVKHQKRVIFPSTSEVYGMCPDKEFDEEKSVLVTGPINKERWIYSCSKQMMDRVIYAYGAHQQLNYTLFRPFNWTGPKLDNVHDPRPGSSRVTSQFISNILHGKDITLVNGGHQQRSFIDIDDGIKALLKMIANDNNCAAQRIFNIGNPNNDISIRSLATLLLSLIKTYPKYAALANKTQLVEVSGEDHFGKGYQDIEHRVPSIKNAQHYLGWEPSTSIEMILKKILDYHLT